MPDPVDPQAGAEGDGQAQARADRQAQARADRQAQARAERQPPDQAEPQPPAQPRARIRLRDVAEHAGVSVGSASNAFNHPELVSDDVRERVDAAARELGYAGPDPAARRLRTGRAGALGLIFTDSLQYAFTDPAAPLFLRGVAAAMAGSGSGLLIVPASPTPEAAGKAVHEAAVDGFIVYSTPSGDPRVAAAIERHLPMVTVDQPRSADRPFVGIDDRGAARAAARHLRDLGHERVAVLSFAREVAGDPTLPFELTSDRLAGYRDGLGSAWSDDLLRLCLPNDPSRARQVAGELLKRPDRPTGILAMSDVLALGVLEAAHDAGIRVPEDLSVVGFDDSPPARLTVPQLTTVSQPHEQKGRIATEMLVTEIEGEGEATDGGAERRILPAELVVRDSTAPPPA